MAMFLVGLLLVGIGFYVDVKVNGFREEFDPGTFKDNKN